MPCCDADADAVAAAVRDLAGRGLLIVGVGNPSRGDDGAGLLLGSAVAHTLGVGYIAGEDVPEHYTAEMRQSAAMCILLVDAVDMKMPPGHIALLRIEDLEDTSISTHKVSLAVLARLLESTGEKRVYLLGIQPGQLQWGHEVEEPLPTAVARFVAELSSAQKAARSGGTDG